MFTDEPIGRPQQPSVTSSASLSADLSWLLSVAARPSMQAKYPKLAEMFHGREDLAERIRNFWDDGSQEMCFTEMQVLVHHGGGTCETDPEAVWRAIENAVVTVPVELEMPSESPEELAIYVARFRKLKESPELVPRTSTSSRRCGRPSTTSGNSRCPSSKKRVVTSWPSTTRTVNHWINWYSRSVTSSATGCPRS